MDPISKLKGTKSWKNRIEFPRVMVMVVADVIDWGQRSAEIYIYSP